MAVKLMPVAQVGLEPAQPVEAEVQEKPRQPRKKRKSAVYDADGNEVLITLKCLKCGRMHPLGNFGLRKMADGAIRNQPWCRECRGASSPKKKKAEVAAEAAERVASEPGEVLDGAPSAVEPAPTPAPASYSGPMQVVPLTAEQVLRALAPRLPEQPPAMVEAPEPTKPVEPQPE